MVYSCCEHPQQSDNRGGGTGWRKHHDQQAVDVVHEPRPVYSECRPRRRSLLLDGGGHLFAVARLVDPGLVGVRGAGSGGDRLGGGGHRRRPRGASVSVEGSPGAFGEALRAAVAGRREQLLHQQPRRPPVLVPGKLPVGKYLLGTK